MNYAIGCIDIRNAKITVRITALWAFSEAFLGGILHGLHVPFAGLFLSFIASVCITIIAAGTKKRGEILKATFLVLAIKFILSPHTPPMAYLAVFMQGLAGELFFMLNRQSRLAAFLLTLFSLLYSACQHLLILTLVFGKNFWTAIDIFFNKIMQTFYHGSHLYSLGFIVFYLGCYFIVGIIGGFMNMGIVKKIVHGNTPAALLNFSKSIAGEPAFFVKQAKRKIKITSFLIGVPLVIFLIISYLPFFQQTVLKNQVVEVILRVTIFLLARHFFFMPIIKYLMDKWIEKYKGNKKSAINHIITLIPDIRNILGASWTYSAHKNKMIHVKNFIYNSIFLVVSYE